MLTCFPTPYPGEWWYSVLCRYHVRSGNPKQQTTIRSLFPGHNWAAINAVTPNNTIRRVVSQLPPNILDIRTVVLSHTLFPYFTRFFTMEKKSEQLERACLGDAPVITSLHRFSELNKWVPKYCPGCVRENRAAYGEAYWHMEHQIPLMTLCPVHAVPLRTPPDVDASRMSFTFFPLERYAPGGEEENQSTAPGYTLKIAKILSDYVRLPMEAAATTGYSNLATALEDKGYGVIQANSPHQILDAKRLYHDLVGYYGQELVERIFGPEKSVYTINRICKWGMTTPERYALLQCYAGIESAVLFGSKVQSCLEGKLHELSNEERLYTRKQVLERLGVTPSQLSILIRRCQMKPFWQQNSEERAKKFKISVLLSEEEFRQYKQALEKSEYQYDSQFIRHMIQTYLEEGDGAK